MAAPDAPRTVRALPVIALSLVLCTAALILWIGKRDEARQHAVVPVAIAQDTDHYVAGTPPAVAERFLRAWMRQQYAVARDLSTGPMRAHAERTLQTLQTLTPTQQQALEETQAYTLATQYDLEHVESEDLSADEQGHPRKQVRGQAHAHGNLRGTRVDSRRGQTFTMVLVDGAWRVSERQWERAPSDTDGGAP
jgi:hypothetical protein